MRVAFWTPLPPQPSGIADYSFSLLGQLADRVDLVAIVRDEVARHVVAPAGVRVASSTDYNSGRAGRFDIDVYQMGNDLRFHGYMHAQLLDHPGVVVLHDIALVDFYSDLCGGIDRSIFLEEARYNLPTLNGSLPVIAVDGRKAPDHLQLLMSRRVVESSLITIVHSEWARDELQRRSPSAHIRQIHHFASVLASPFPLRRQPLSEVRFGVFGGLSEPKRILSVVEAVARVHADYPQVRVEVVGRVDQPAFHRRLRRHVRGRRLDGIISINSAASPEDLERSVQRCDAAIALRWPTAGETSGVVMRALGAGKPVIVSDLPQYRELDGVYCWTVPTDYRAEVDGIERLMRNVVEDPGAARDAGNAAQAFVEANATLQISSDHYFDAITAAIPLKRKAPPLVPLTRTLQAALGAPRQRFGKRPAGGALRIAVCHAQVPLEYGGAEALVETLRDALIARGHSVAIVQLPYTWHPRTRLLRNYMAWRFLDLTERSTAPMDLVIATKFPSYFIRHPNKSVWLTHQFRQAYELAGTEFSDFNGGIRDRTWQRLIRQCDNSALGEAQRLYTISSNTSNRLARFNGIQAEHLYPPPPLTGQYRCAEASDYVLSVGRLEPLKRPAILVEAMRYVRSEVSCRIVGDGPLRRQLELRVAELGLTDRVHLLGRVANETLIELYSRALAVYYAPYDEDYGYVTVEAMASCKPVITLVDAGGPLEFVEDGITGWVQESDPVAVALAIDEASGDRARTASLGEAARALVDPITWDAVVEGLVG